MGTGKDPCYVHNLKTLPSFFADAVSGTKTFEIRKNDRNFQVGDWLHLREFDGEDYTGEEAHAQVTYLTDYQQKAGYVVMAIHISPEALPIPSTETPTHDERVKRELLQKFFKDFSEEYREISKEVFEAAKRD